jgi:hypothetical protein
MLPCRLFRRASLLCTLALALAVPVRAQDGPKGDGLKPPPPQTRTITVTECVEEKFQEKRTCYRTECRTVQYDTFRCEPVCEVRERVCQVVKRVPVHTVETRKVCCNEWRYEDRCVMKPCWEYKQVTTCVKKCVSKGHWECQTVCAKPGLLAGLCSHGDRCGHGGCGNSCGHNGCGHKGCGHDRCRASCNTCCETRTKKVWVHCPVYVDCPVTKCVKVCVQKPVVCKQKVCHQVVKEVQVPVCTYRCVTEQVTQKYTVQTMRQVPCKATRQERVCVPYEETVWCTRLVPRTREVQVAETPCCTPCCTPCREHCPRHCGGLRFREHGCCH